MTDKEKYRSSFGATILFSGVQLYQILVRVIKYKFVALFIGPAGMGIQSLLHSTTDLISASSSLGLKTSGVKTVAKAYTDNDADVISRTIVVLRRLILITGLSGMAICAIFSPVWSNISFGNSNYVLSFAFVSIIILFDQLNNGELVLLQGMRQKKILAKANVLGQTIGLLITIPLYYYFRIKAIVWVMIFSSLVTYVVARFYTSRLNIAKSFVSWRDTFSIGWEMIKLGFFLSLQFLLSNLVIYIVRNYVSAKGGVEEVGLYSAGTSIVSVYIGMIFSAIATDYFPRLAATKNNSEMKEAVHTQIEIFLLLLAPLVIAFIVFLKPFIILIYSDSFLPIENMLYWSIGATLLQAMGWAVSYTILAKAKPSVFFLNEVVASLYTVPLRLLGYSLWGLTGFGIAMLSGYLLYMIQVLFLAKRLFEFSYNKTVWNLLLKVSAPVILVVILKKYLIVSNLMNYLICSLILLLFASWVIIELNKKIDFISILKQMKMRYGK